MIGLFSKLNDKICTAELDQRTRELSEIVDAITGMKPRELKSLGKRMAKLESDVAKTYKAPTSDVFKCEGRCWKNRGAILGDLRATSKGMKQNLQSVDPVARTWGRQTSTVCNLLTVIYRAAILENDTKSLVEPCSNVRVFAANLAETLTAAGQENADDEQIENLRSDIVRGFAALN